MDHIRIGDIETSRFLVGSNPFSGFSHQGPERDQEMRRYFTAERIKEMLREAESLGVTGMVARTDHHVMRLLLEYWDQGGTLTWFAQTCPEVGNHEMCVTRAADGGAEACHVHGGVMDFLYAQGKLDEIPPVIRMIRERGMQAGIAAHNPKVIQWAEENLDVDYYMCSYYNAAHRDERAEHVSGMKEWFLEEDRRIMTGLIGGLSRPVIHYKVMAAGRNEPKEAFDYVAKSMRATDAVCVGIYPGDKPDMLSEDIRLFDEACKVSAPTG